METSTLLFQLAILCALWRQSNEQNYLTRVDKCPLSKEKWEDTAEKANCPGIKTYHCVLSVQKNLYEGCMYPENITGWQCPQVRGINGDFDFEHVNFNCSSGDLCPKAGLKYRSDQLYKFPGCLGITQIETTTTSTTTTTTTRSTVNDQTYISSSIPGSNRNESEPSTHSILIGVLFGIIVVAVILAVVVCYLRRTKRCCQTTRTFSTQAKSSNGEVQRNAYNPVPLTERENQPNGPTHSVGELNGIVVLPDTSVPQPEQCSNGEILDNTQLDVDNPPVDDGGGDAQPDTPESTGDQIGGSRSSTPIVQHVTNTYNVYNGPVIQPQISVEKVDNFVTGDENVIQYQTGADKAATENDQNYQ